MLNLGPHLSREFHRFTKSISEAKSKQEEERIISREISLLKLNFQNKNVTKSQLKEYLIRCLYIEMFGFNTKFAYIHALNMAQDKQLTYKSIGYLCCTLMIKSDNDLTLLLINTIQKDLQSINFMDRLIVLTNLCYLVNEEMLPIVFELIHGNLNHENEFVRKKTILALTRIYELYPNHVEKVIFSIIQKGICDVDPSVMNATLNLLLLYLDDPNNEKKENKIFINPLISIWKQILDNKLTKDYNYHKVPAPFIQIKIMKILSKLCEDEENSNSIYGILHKFTQFIENNNHFVTYTLIYQFIQLLSHIVLNETLRSLASIYLSKLINCNVNNIKYISVKSINMLIEKNIVVKMEDQLKLINLLQEDDSTVQKTIIKLLYKLINANNYNTIIEHLLNYLLTQKEQLSCHEKNEIIFKIIEFCKKYCGDVVVYVNIVLQIIQISYKQLNNHILYNIIDLIHKYQNNKLNYYVLNQCYQIYKDCNKNNELLIKLIVWIIKYIIYQRNNLSDKRLEEVEKLESLDNDLEYDLELYKNIINEILTNCNNYDCGLLYWVLNNCREISVYLKYDMNYSLMSHLENKYTNLIRQILLEINNLSKSQLSLKLNTKDYDLKLTFLKDYVEKSGGEGYRREEVMSKYKRKESQRVEEEELNEKGNKLIYKPYLLMTNSMENVTQDNVSQEKLILTDKASRSWGPKGYLNGSGFSNKFENRIENKVNDQVRVEEDKKEEEGSQVKQEDPKFNIDNIMLEKYESNSSKWSSKDMERQKNELLAKQLFQNISSNDLEGNDREEENRPEM